MRIRVSTVVPARPPAVWADVQDIASHVEWMADAEAIRFTGPQRQGVGTTFDCDTRVGPFRLVDRMAVTEWEEGRAIGIRHVGLVEGAGRFTLRRTWRGHTRFTWTETLRFPWWMGGPVGAQLGRPVLHFIWKRNLTRLQARFASRERPGQARSRSATVQGQPPRHANSATQRPTGRATSESRTADLLRRGRGRR